MSDSGMGAVISKEAAAIGRISELVSELTEAARSDAATSAFGLLLTIDEKAARDAAQELLPSVRPIRDAGVAGRTLKAARRRAVDGWPDWLGAIEHDLADDVGVQAEIRSLAVHVWIKSTEVDSTYSEDDVDAALGALASLANRKIGNWDSLDTRVSDDVSAVSLDSSTAERQMELVDLAIRLSDQGLIEFKPAAAALAERTIEAFQMQSPPLEISDPLSMCVARLTELTSVDISVEARTRLSDSASSSPWLQSPLKEEIVLLVAREQLRAGDVTEPPIDSTEIVALADGQGTRAQGALTIWFEEFATNPSDVADVIQALPTNAITPTIEKALAKYATRHAAGASSVAVALIKSLQERVPSKALLRSLRSATHSDADLADVLIDSYEAANNNEERENVLRAWEAAEPSDDATRRALIRRVLLPCAAGSKRGLDIVLKHLRVAIPAPHGTKAELKKALKDAARDSDQRRRVSSKLVDVGLVSRGVLGFGRRDL